MVSFSAVRLSFFPTYKIEKRFGFSILAAGLPVDIPTGWEPRIERQLVVRALRVAFADYSAASWQGFEKSERCPNNSSLFQPLAAVVVVAVQVLLSAVATKEGVYSEINQR